MPKRPLQTAVIKPKLEQPSPTWTKPLLTAFKPKMEVLPKEEPENVKIESKEEVESDVKQLFSDVKKGLMEQGATNSKLLDMISQLREQIAEKNDKIAEQAEEITDKDRQIVKYQLMQG